MWAACKVVDDCEEKSALLTSSDAGVDTNGNSGCSAYMTNDKLKWFNAVPLKNKNVFVANSHKLSAELCVRLELNLNGRIEFVRLKNVL